jgi:AcrR family transcriptional regulator
MPDDLPARGRILAAAERLFAERGFDHTSTALIAAEARVPQGLIFYHFKTKMELLLAVIREDQASLLDGLLPALAPAGDPAAGDPDDTLRQAVAALWRHLSAVLGEPSPVRKIIIQELAAHPEIRQRALELHEQMAASVACYLAQAGPHPREPGPGHQAAARLLTIAAGMAPLLGEPSLTLIPPDVLGALVSDGLRPAGKPRDTRVLPEQSREDTDAGWGERAESDDDERFYRDRPPHWDSR